MADTLITNLTSKTAAGTEEVPVNDSGADKKVTTASIAALNDAAIAAKAPIDSPTFTGTPAAPTAVAGTNTTQIATTAFVAAAIAALINSAPGALDTLDELAAALGDDANYASTITAALALKAPLASPALTGTPTVPTAAEGTNTTQAASTAFVTAAIAALGTVVTVSDPGANRFQIWDESTNQPALSANPAIPSNAISASDIDWNASQTHSKTLSANTTFTFSNATDGQTIVVAITNTASNYTVTWPTVSWSGGVAPTQTTGAKTDIWTFVKIGSTIYGSVVQNF